MDAWRGVSFDGAGGRDVCARDAEVVVFALASFGEELDG